MKSEFGLINGHPLSLFIPEDPKEMENGYRGRDIKEGEAMFFPLGRAQLVPIEVGGLAGKLDILFLVNNKIRTMVEKFKGDVICAPADAVLEVPAGFCEKQSLKLNDVFVLLKGFDAKES